MILEWDGVLMAVNVQMGICLRSHQYPRLARCEQQCFAGFEALVEVLAGRNLGFNDGLAAGVATFSGHQFPAGNRAHHQGAQQLFWGWG